jgi:hypothetical protein
MRSALEYVCASNAFGTVRNKDGFARTISVELRAFDAFVGPEKGRQKRGR